MKIPDYIAFRLPDLHHGGMGIEILSSDPQKIQGFNEKCLLYFHGRKEYQAFHQGSAPDWSYFECWADYITVQDGLMNLVLDLGSELGLETCIK